MTKKENKGGILHNDQIEKDLKAKGRTTDSPDGYSGSQDNGDKVVREAGNDVQQRDGLPKEEQNGER